MIPDSKFFYYKNITYCCITLNIRTQASLDYAVSLKAVTFYLHEKKIKFLLIKKFRGSACIKDGSVVENNCLKVNL